MGQQQSAATAITSAINKSLTKVMMDSSTACGQNNAASQNFSLTGIDAGNCNVNVKSNQVMVQKPNFTCTSTSQQNSALQTALKATLKSEAEANNAGIGGVSSNARTYLNSTAIQDVTNDIDIKSTATCIQNNLASQNAVINAIKSSCPKICGQTMPATFTTPAQIKAWGDTINEACNFNVGSAQDLTQTATASCLAENSQLQNTINKVAAEITQEAAATNTGLQLPSLTSSYIGSAISCVIVCLMIVAFFAMGGPEAIQAAKENGGE